MATTIKMAPEIHVVAFLKDKAMSGDFNLDFLQEEKRINHMDIDYFCGSCLASKKIFFLFERK